MTAAPEPAGTPERDGRRYRIALVIEQLGLERLNESLDSGLVIEGLLQQIRQANTLHPLLRPSQFLHP